METPWERLSRVVAERIEHIGITRDELHHAHGAPSPQYIRALKRNEGRPSTRHAASLRQLSEALGWEPDTAWNLLAHDRSDWSQDLLDDEEDRLILPDTPTTPRPIGRPSVQEEKIRAFQTAVGAKLRDVDEREALRLMRELGKVLGIG